LSFGPSHLKFVLTEPVVPRSGRLNTHHPKSPMTRRIAAPAAIAILFMLICSLKGIVRQAAQTFI
jgi:hypothetical protein